MTTASNLPVTRALLSVSDKSGVLEFARRFEEHDPANERFFTPGREGHHQFDLEGYVASRLAAAGIGRVCGRSSAGSIGSDARRDGGAIGPADRAGEQGAGCAVSTAGGSERKVRG